MRYCGREFSEQELAWIREQVASDPTLSRRRLSERFCEHVSWRKPDGGTKAMSCRVAFLRMAEDGLITLPPPKRGANRPKVRASWSLFTEPRSPVTAAAGDFELTFELATKGLSTLWGEYIERYHYLGYSPLPGAQLRYFVLCQGEVAALVGLSAAAWKIAPRDAYIGWSHEQRRRNLHLVVNNSRFLRLPWFPIRNLCSRILSRVCRRLADDWEKVYAYRPVLVETFVERERFSGACYKAANWQYVGDTTGRGKLSRHKRAELPIKGIFVFPLQPDFREVLCT